MADFPPSVLVGAALVLTIWLTTMWLAVSAIRRRGAPALVFAVMALSISVVGILIEGHLTHSQSSSITMRHGKILDRSSNWTIDSRWLFAVSGTLSFAALLLGAARQKSKPSQTLEPTAPAVTDRAAQEPRQP